MKSYPVIVALDGLSLKASIHLAKLLGPHVWGFKVHELLIREGFGVIKKLKGFGKVFVDLKLHDIPSTVEHEVKALVAHGAAIVSVHASGGRDMLEAAVRAGGTTIAAVTVLSSMSKGEARKASHLATHAHAAGVTSLICSPHELGALKKLGRARLITPGIRSPGARMHDQARTMPAREALARGADLLVIGRPITESDKPLDVLFELVES